jgi:ActR/RegA family two-component response regulator
VTRQPRVLLADDNDAVRVTLQRALESDGFEVVTANSVVAALRHITTETFDVLLSDLHMPNAGDGFTVVSAMRHIHPQAVTLILTGYPELEEAMSVILLQADEVLVKPIRVSSLREIIHRKLATHEVHPRELTKSVASILEGDLENTIQGWMALVEKDDELTWISLSFQERTGHLPQLLRDLIYRLRLPAAITSPFSIAARDHGNLRRRQGYTAAMLVEESRILQVSIFNTLQNNLRNVDFSKVLLDVITIADEVDSQLKQTMLSFVRPDSTLSVA